MVSWNQKLFLSGKGSKCNKQTLQTFSFKSEGKKTIEDLFNVLLCTEIVDY